MSALVWVCVAIPPVLLAAGIAWSELDVWLFDRRTRRELGRPLTVHEKRRLRHAFYDGLTFGPTFRAFERRRR